MNVEWMDRAVREVEMDKAVRELERMSVDIANISERLWNGMDKRPISYTVIGRLWAASEVIDNAVTQLKELGYRR